ncbi:hypothetical protein A3A66_04690 [Microgenomates group bacterium RIFCSPLOWO2_01_FULL_46_13]|nr:MAG: hypothetical protein A3A66_04690 [Microgenomates group bacterium RIFCSPLOWO2_01_FULL_46_13]
MSDLTLTCTDCGNEFVWSEGEQDFYRQKGLKLPLYCPICRGRRRAEAQFKAKLSLKKSKPPPLTPD